MQIDMNQFLESFFDEADEHIENMEAALLELESSPSDTELLNTIFRSAHTIKGASSTFGVTAVAEFTHVMENLLDRMRDGEIQANAEISEALLASVDALRSLLEAARNGTPGPDNIDELLKQLQALNTSDGAADAGDASEAESTETQPKNEGPTVYDVAFKPSRDFFHFGLEPILLIRDLSEVGTIEEVTLDDSALPPIDEMDPESCYLSWNLRLSTTEPTSKIDDVFMFVDDETLIEISAAKESDANGDGSVAGEETTAPTEADDSKEEASPESKPESAATSAEENAAEKNAQEEKPNEAPQAQTEAQKPTPQSPAAQAKAPAAPTPHRESVRVDGERLDDMITQIGELVIGVSMVEEEWAEKHPGSDSPAVVQLSKIVRELQERSLSLRMIPIGACFQKMARVVRDLSRKLGKKIEFVTSGEETELDKTVVDKIGDPLLHMIRNAVDHGIESVEEREAAGKSPKGKVTLKAFHKGGNIYIEIVDDGKGLNLERIKKKAIERGVITEEDNPSEQELANLIFAAGFSTAEKVTDVSGRGVGMDVVRRNVESLQGSVSVRTKLGEGSTVTVRLPLTLAILDGLTVRLGDEVFVLPLLSVVESIRPSAADLKTVVNRGEVVMLRGEVVPLLRLHELLKINTNVTSASEGLLVIVEEQHRKFALLVDELLGQQQVVIKNLETNFRKVPGVAGATILGNGRVAFILDINGICTLSRSAPAQRADMADTSTPGPRAAETKDSLLSQS